MLSIGTGYSLAEVRLLGSDDSLPEKVQRLWRRRQLGRVGALASGLKEGDIPRNDHIVSGSVARSLGSIQVRTARFTNRQPIDVFIKVSWGDHQQDPMPIDVLAKRVHYSLSLDDHGTEGPIRQRMHTEVFPRSDIEALCCYERHVSFLGLGEIARELGMVRAAQQ